MKPISSIFSPILSICLVILLICCTISSCICHNGQIPYKLHWNKYALLSSSCKSNQSARMISGSSLFSCWSMKLLIYEDELSLPQPSFQLCRCLKRGNSVSLEGIKTKCRGKLILPPADLKCVHRETAQRYLFCFCSSVQNLAGHPYNFFYTCNGCLFQFPNILRSFRNQQGSKM